MKKLLLSVLILISTFAYAETADRIVAIVGSDVITLYDLDTAMASKLNSIKSSPNRDGAYKAAKSEALDRLIDDRLLTQAMESSKISVTNEEIARAISNICSQNGITIDALRAELSSKGVAFESYKNDIKQSIMRMKFVNQEIGQRVKISDAEMRDYYNKHMNEFSAAKSAHIAQIVLPLEDGVTMQQLKTKAQEIVSKARSGHSFAELARQHSKASNASLGGDLGVVDPMKLNPDVANILAKMRTGQISDPIASPAGIVIIHLIDRAQASEADFEKMKDSINNKMYESRVQDELANFLGEMRRKTYIEIKDAK